MPEQRILVVDDEPGMLEVCSDTLGRLPDTSVVVESDGERADQRIRNERFDLLVLDIRLPGVSGVDLLRTARDADPSIPVLMITAFPTIETAVQCMKLGAADYITKPFIPDDLLATAKRLLEHARLAQENRLLKRQIDKPYCFDEIVGKCPAMQGVFESIQLIARTDADVLVTGETGTGKELVARSIHKRSARKNARFVPVDCGAIPEDLLESEFFGHERGAFTGAQTRSLGLLEFAHTGTFFLDEVGELPIRLQAKLLRVLQERTIRRVGGTEQTKVDVRVIAATSRNLEQEIQAGRFRSDLYYRINVARIELPPLRERQECIPLLVEYFMDRFAHQMGREGVQIDAEAVEVLTAYSWPGNVRELQNVLKRTLAMARQDILKVDDLPGEIVEGVAQGGTPKGDGFFALRQRRISSFEKEYLSGLLDSCHGDATEAARQAKLPRGTLYRLLSKHHLSAAQFRR